MSTFIIFLPFLGKIWLRNLDNLKNFVVKSDELISEITSERKLTI